MGELRDQFNADYLALGLLVAELARQPGQDPREIFGIREDLETVRQDCVELVGRIEAVIERARQRQPEKKRRRITKARQHEKEGATV
jgi:hypothetical protein